MSDETQTTQLQTDQPSAAADGGKEKFNFMRWLKGNNRAEFLENFSFVIIIISAILVGVGVILGTTIKYAVLLASFGAFLLLPGIAIYIASQLMEIKKEEKK